MSIRTCMQVCVFDVFYLNILNYLIVSTINYCKLQLSTKTKQKLKINITGCQNIDHIFNYFLRRIF